MGANLHLMSTGIALSCIIFSGVSENLQVSLENDLMDQKIIMSNGFGAPFLMVNILLLIGILENRASLLAPWMAFMFGSLVMSPGLVLGFEVFAYIVGPYQLNFYKVSNAIIHLSLGLIFLEVVRKTYVQLKSGSKEVLVIKMSQEDIEKA